MSLFVLKKKKQLILPFLNVKHIYALHFQKQNATNSSTTLYRFLFCNSHSIIRSSKQIPLDLKSRLQRIPIDVREAAATRSHAAGEALYLSSLSSNV